MDCYDSDLIRFIYAIIFQVVLIFMFLTIFFFAYVVRVEKEDYSRQIQIIVDDIYVKEDVGDLLNSGIDTINGTYPSITKDKIRQIIDTGIQQSKASSSASMKDKITETETKNKKVRITGIMGVVIGLALLIAVTLIGVVTNFCIPVYSQLKETLIIVFFVGLTEFTFLTLIASKYISADSYKVQRQFGDALVEYADTKLTNFI